MNDGTASTGAERSALTALRRWYTAAWLLLGLIPTVIGVGNDPGPLKWASLTLVAAALAYTAVHRARHHSPAYLAALAAGLGAMAALPGGGAALLIAALPQFWFQTRGPRTAVLLSGCAAAATAAGSVWRDSPGNAAAALTGYAVSVLAGLLLHRLVTDGEARATTLAAELSLAQERLAAAHRARGAADERERMAREIHDTLAQGFASIIVLAEAARAGLDEDAEHTARQLRSIEQTARENFAEARVLVGAAPHSGLRPGSVVPTLRRTLERFTQDTGITVDAELAEDVHCDQQTRIALLRCTQESLANVRKHADASTVGVVLAQGPYAIELEITDDGRGFVVEESRGFGLDGMRKRLAELDGELTVTSSVGDGTRVLATFHTNGRP
ncbi:sensor histidine kinase [Streptomyces tanashiensis]|uniref:histidine kinase n=1 Tax=Streptomyces tanashiensis TaxID=67367 RepID=A0ABY6QRU6_9ACTN|nr:sensor histidine kinase [Streptomyces tanashiensis]UZX20032.1 sensor histidine kinase [Streptomyces tanashiensis]